MNSLLNVLGYYTSSCLRHKNSYEIVLQMNRKYFGLHLSYVLYAIPSTEGLKAEAAGKRTSLWVMR